MPDLATVSFTASSAAAADGIGCIDNRRLAKELTLKSNIAATSTVARAGREEMCTHCPRCMTLHPCNDAIEDGHDEAGRYEHCIDVFEHPWICQHCFPDVEM
jgi:hypothetical protein